jgi:hypothetical protein
MPADLPGGRPLSADEHLVPELRLGSLEELPSFLLEPRGLDLAAPGSALMLARTGLERRARSFFYTTSDRCRSWQGPFCLPDFGLGGTAARTDVVVLFSAETRDGCRTFSFLSWVGPEPEGYRIMPSTVHLGGGVLLCAVRCRGPRGAPERGGWIELYASRDFGRSWRHQGTPVQHTGSGGNPPMLLALPGSGLCLIYGYRDPPQGIRARVSPDLGGSWSPEIILRDDGGDWDLGYPRAVLRPDGSIVIAYYFNTDTNEERFIGCTVWDPRG